MRTKEQLIDFSMEFILQIASFDGIKLDEKTRSVVKAGLENLSDSIESNEKDKLRPLEWHPLPEFGDHMTMEEWIEDVKSGCLIDYDGYGKYASVDRMSSLVVIPSDVKYDNISGNTEFTHVVWFNR